MIAIFVYMGAGQEASSCNSDAPLSDTVLRSCLLAPGTYLNLQSTIKDAIDLTLTTFQSEFPVWDGGQLMGLLTHHRLLETLNQRGSETLVRDVMRTDVRSVSPDADLLDVQQSMAEQKLEAVPVRKRWMLPWSSHDTRCQRTLPARIRVIHFCSQRRHKTDNWQKAVKQLFTGAMRKCGDALDYNTKNSPQFC